MESALNFMLSKMFYRTPINVFLHRQEQTVPTKETEAGTERKGQPKVDVWQDIYLGLQEILVTLLRL